MGENREVFRKRIGAFFSFLADVVGTAWLLPYVAAFGAPLILWIATIWAPGWRAAAGYAFAVALGVVGAVAIPVFSYLRHGSARWVIRGYRTLDYFTEYQIDASDPRRHRQLIRQTIETTRQGLDLVEMRYLWSGQGSVEITVQSPGHLILGEGRRSRGWLVYKVDLGRPHPRDSRIEIEVVKACFDEEETFEPYIAKEVTERMKNLQLRVKLPSGLHPDSVALIRYSGSGAHISRTKAEIGEFDKLTETAEWSIDRPKLGYIYEIRWAYTARTSIY